VRHPLESGVERLFRADDDRSLGANIADAGLLGVEVLGENLRD
jgi:hypothetical protein